MHTPDPRTPRHAWVFTSYLHIYSLVRLFGIHLYNMHKKVAGHLIWPAVPLLDLSHGIIIQVTLCAVVEHHQGHSVT